MINTFFILKALKKYLNLNIYIFLLRDSRKRNYWLIGYKQFKVFATWSELAFPNLHNMNIILIKKKAGNICLGENVKPYFK